MFGLTYNEFGGYYEGNAWAARGDAMERQQLQEEREHAAMERMAKLYAAMALAHAVAILPTGKHGNTPLS